MNPAAEPHNKVFLKPGELMVTELPTQVSTVLGSCVAVTFYNRRLKYGAICHAMLPYGEDKVSFKYLNEAFAFMLAKFTRAGIERRETEVKLFGGSEVLPQSASRSLVTVGRQNIELAKTLIRQEGLILQAENSGGSQGRKIHFYTHTGEILLKRLQKTC